MIKLGVNIDHVATVRQARRTMYPDLIAAARAAERGGADAVTVHLREDRRHVQDEDVVALKSALETRLNLEIAVTSEMISFAREVCPADACLVPERREELTTEGGLDVAGAVDRIRDAVAALHAAGIRVSLFIDSEERQIEAAAKAGAQVIELHTGAYADATASADRTEQLHRFRAAASAGARAGLAVNAGHGLTLENVSPIASCLPVRELNIGHSIVARALFVGLEAATREMKERMLAARRTVTGGGTCS